MDDAFKIDLKDLLSMVFIYTYVLSVVSETRHNVFNQIFRAQMLIRLISINAVVVVIVCSWTHFYICILKFSPICVYLQLYKLKSWVQ